MNSIAEQNFKRVNAHTTMRWLTERHQKLNQLLMGTVAILLSLVVWQILAMNKIRGCSRLAL
ncbi:hypothetical protein MOW08_07075 [Acinetobacter schindleri]|nr:hypothetical protein MOW08_07075 [Acinetobacter schindleri]